MTDRSRHQPGGRHARTRWRLALLLCAAAPWPAVPAGPTALPLAAACQACHGHDGISESADIPNLAGQKSAYLVRQLEAFKRGERKNDLMAAVAAQLTEADIRELARIWSAMPAMPAEAGRASAGLRAIRSRMAFPADFATRFSLYETVANTPDAKLIRRYANDSALRALREGRPLSHGAAIVVATHALALDAAGQPVAGPLISYAAMESRDGWGEDVPALLRNGDWDYALFGADRVRRDSLNQAACLACHKPMADRSFVFTLPALAAFASGSPVR